VRPGGQRVPGRRGRYAVPLAAALGSLVTFWASACGGNAAGPRGTIAVTAGSLHATRQIALIDPASRTTLYVIAPDDVVRYDLSPDGSRIAVTGFEGVWIMERDGSDPRLVSRADGFGEIAWSPDGRQLVLARSDDVLFTMSADGRQLRRIVDHADQPDWSPDGKSIVFVSHPEQTSRSGTISAIGSDGRGLRRIASGVMGAEPRVSPDESVVVFNNGEGTFLAPWAGGKARLLIRDAYRPVWSPDGRYLAFTRQLRCEDVCSSRVFIRRVSGGRPRAYGPVLGDMGPLSWSQ
jgi:Tol biopolymer transport system component